LPPPCNLNLHTKFSFRNTYFAGRSRVDARRGFVTVNAIAMKKETVSRFSVSLPPSLLRQLDEMTGEKGYDNRSLAIADMIRNHLVEHRQKFGTEDIAGTITLVYDHHKQHVQESLTDIQHDHHDVILSTVHVHLDHHNCLEVLLVRGQAAVIRKIADELITAKGVKHGKLTVTTTGRDLPS
jgi:CopG family nickel-responsive transcriptional regulator